VSLTVIFFFLCVPDDTIEVLEFARPPNSSIDLALCG